MEQTSKNKFDFSLWETASEERLNIAEEKRQRALNETFNALNILSAKYNWNEIYIFGSILQKGRFAKQSDVDIGVEGLNKFEHYQFISDLSLILNRDVDVIRFEDCEFAEVIKRRGIKWIKGKQLYF